MLQTVLDALCELRSPFALYENDLHCYVRDCLNAAGLEAKHEASIGEGCRIDYLVGDVGIEIKKGKPVAAVLLKQLKRYAACEGVNALVLVAQSSVKLPASICGKPLRMVALNQLWGVALG
ncbi:MAG: hypothetical protein RSE58_01820 [Clostridia bacterium]